MCDEMLMCVHLGLLYEFSSHNFYLDFGLDIFDSIGSLDLERDGLARQRLDEDLHATA